HFIGEHYGVIPELEPELSVVRMQEKLAVEHGDDAEFSRLIWMPPGLRPADERQQKFVAELQNSFASRNGSDLIQVKTEDLKSIIQNKLSQKQKPAEEQSGETGYIYLIADRQDMDAAQPLRDHLFDLGYEVVLPLLEGSEAETLEDHRQNLLLCH